MASESEVLFESVNNAGVVTLNRPKSLNALNHNMVARLLPTLREWERTKTCVIVKGAGKAFCAGGDVKSLNHSAKAFAIIEYNINYLIGGYRVPYVAFVDGVAMGGGLGLSVHGRWRVATEAAVVAMPETQIGLLPDVGGTYFLPRLKQHLGFYMGLTGKRLRGGDVVTSGIGTHFVRSSRLPALETKLSRCCSAAQVQNCLDSSSEPPGEFSLAEHLENIDYCFSPSTVEEIIRRLSEINNQWYNETLERLSRMCPVMLKVTLRALRQGRRQTLGQCLQTEYRVVSRCTGSHNFREGKRLKGKDVVLSGIATHFVSNARFSDLQTQLSRCSDESEIAKCLNSFSEPPGEFSLAEHLENIDYCFSSSTVEEIIRRLSEINNQWSNETLQVLSHMCPTMLKVGLRAMRRGLQQDFAECLKMEYRFTSHNVGSYNFREGVRARLIDKDNRPRWRPASLAEVSEAEVEAYFRRLPGDKELKFFASKL